MMRLALASLVLLAACGTGPGRPTQRELDRVANQYAREEYRERQQEEAGQRAPADTCGAATHQSLIGVARTDLVAPANARVVCHNCPVTMDFNATRLTIQLGPDDKVVSLQCG